MTTQVTHATAEGTSRYRDRFADRPDHFRQAQGLWLSSFGLGTYLGDPTDIVDKAYVEAIHRAVSLGCNIFDTAINYRHQRSERALGKALKRLFKEGVVQRDEIVIATKGGYVPFDKEPPPDRERYLRDTFVDTALASSEDVIAGHSLAPRFLRAMIKQSLRNLGLSRIDIYFLHNPESQLRRIDRAAFRECLLAAFDALETAADDGLIRYYGLATWSSFRVEPNTDEYISLAEINRLARKARGIKHRCRFVQLPLSLAMPEAITLRNQVINGEKMSVLEAATRLGLSVMGSAPLMQAGLLNQLPPPLREKFDGLSTDAQRCLQFARSTPGITTALAGMSHAAHVEENLATTCLPPLTSEQYQALFA